MELRGASHILEYLDELDRSIKRNEAALRPAFAEANPYVTKKRVFLHGSALVGLTGTLGAVATWTLPSLIAFDLGLNQAVTLLVTVPLGGFATFLLGWPATSYVRGVAIKQYRAAYEEMFGVESMSSGYGKFIRLREIIARAGAHPDLLIHVTDRRRFDNHDKHELSAAVAEQRAPSVDFASRQQRPLEISHFTKSDEPISYLPETDFIYFFDSKSREPVLTLVDRFTRDAPEPTRRTPPSVKAERTFGAGGLKPARF